VKPNASRTPFRLRRITGGCSPEFAANTQFLPVKMAIRSQVAGSVKVVRLCRCVRRQTICGPGRAINVLEISKEQSRRKL
jgi:hypothetical protein